MSKAERDIAFHRLSFIMSDLAPMCSKFYFLTRQLDDAERDALLVEAIDSLVPLLDEWNEISKMCSEAYGILKDEEDDFFSGSENMTGEAEDIGS